MAEKPSNIYEKILSAHLLEGALIPGEDIGIKIDQTLTQDATGTMAYLQFESLNVSSVSSELSLSYVDHNTLQQGFENADDHKYLETAASRYGVLFSKPGNGICHQVHLERFARPGKTLLGSGFRSVNVSLRQVLDLYACVRPCKYYQGVNSSLKDPESIDIVVVRENTEDLYAGIEFEQGRKETKRIIHEIEVLTDKRIRADSAVSIKPISGFGSERIVRFAFEYARAHKRRKVTAITKSNIMKSSDGLFQHVAEEVAKGYPEIEFEHKLIDNMCMQLVQKPELYDVLVLPNLYGDIVSDLCAGLVGGLGVAPGANIGDTYAVFEATHGSAPRYKGMNKVNPAALILSGVLMLRHIGEFEAAERLEKATAAVIERGRDVTYDLRPWHDRRSAVGTQEMAEAIIRHIRRD